MGITSTQNLSGLLSHSYTVVSKLRGKWCKSKKSVRVVRAAAAYWGTNSVNALSCTKLFMGIKQKERRLVEDNFVLSQCRYSDF